MFAQLRKGRFALALAMVAIFCLGFAAPALAEDEPTYKPEEAKLTKVILGPLNTDASGDTFVFHFAGAGEVREETDKLVSDGVEQDGRTIAKGDVIPTIPDATLMGREITATNSLTNGQTYQTVRSKSMSEILDGVVFPHAGVYTYKVTETAANTVLTDGSYINPSKAAYILRVRVVNDDSVTNTSKTSVLDVTLERVVNDDGGDVHIGKVDPRYPEDENGKITKVAQDTTPGEGLVGEETDRGRDVPGFTFANEYIKGGPLVVKKVVKGTYGDKTKKFHVQLKLTNEISTSENAQGSAVTYIVNNGDDVTQSNLESDGSHRTINGIPKTLNAFGDSMVEFDSLTGEALIEADLRDGGTITITGLFGPYSTDWPNDPNNRYPGSYRYVASEDGPMVGSEYEIIESTPGNYNPAVYIFNNAVEDPTTETAVASATGDTIDYTGRALDGGTYAYVVNTLDDSYASPTGILINNLPYILMVAVPVGVFAVMFVAKRRASSEA